MIKAILGCDIAFGIGKNGTLPWKRNSEDLKQFKQKTTNHIIVMGSKTWDDPNFPGPLPNRENYVCTSSFGYNGAKILSGNIQDKIVELDYFSKKDIWIIGGNNIIQQCKDIIEEYHFTLFNKYYDCDVYLDFNILNYNMISVEYSKTCDNSYVIYRRKD